MRLRRLPPVWVNAQSGPVGADSIRILKECSGNFQNKYLYS